jgi:hypothetical protein
VDGAAAVETKKKVSEPGACRRWCAAVGTPLPHRRRISVDGGGGAQGRVRVQGFEGGRGIGRRHPRGGRGRWRTGGGAVGGWRVGPEGAKPLEEDR